MPVGLGFLQFWRQVPRRGVDFGRQNPGFQLLGRVRRGFTGRLSRGIFADKRGLKPKTGKKKQKTGELETKNRKKGPGTIFGMRNLEPVLGREFVRPSGRLRLIMARV